MTMPSPFTSGPQPAGYAAAPLLLPFQPDFKKVTEEISVEIKRETVGFTRELDQEFYPHQPARSQLASYTLQHAEPWTMLQFFAQVAGPGASFWASSWLQLALLTADVGDVDVVLHVEDTNAVNVGDYIALYASEIIARKVTGKTADTITIDAAPGVDLAAAKTCLFQLCLAKLSKPQISLKWKRPGLAKCELNWEELPPEYVPGADETLGVTLGKLATRVILFEFNRDYNNGTIITQRFTSFERDLDWSGHAWLSRDLTHKDIPQSLNLENDSTDITCPIFDDNPLLADVALLNEAPLTVTIRHADFDGETLSDVDVVFTGSVGSPGVNGNKISVKCQSGPRLLNNQLPFFIRGKSCNHLRGSNADGSFLISAGCTLLKADWKFTATVAAPLSAAFPYTLHLAALARVAGAAPTYFDDWFAFGVIEWGAGANLQRRLIIGSSTPAGGALTVTLHRYFQSVPLIGDAVVIYPGCDGMAETCKAYDADDNPLGRFDNYLNFGAEPFTPTSNPATTGQPNLGTQGGKK